MAMETGVLEIPAPDVSPQNNKPCYTSRSFQVIDMDPSDNVVSTYIMNGNGLIAQNTLANVQTLMMQQQQNGGGAAALQDLNNGSDNLLLDAFLRPALSCSAFTAKNLADSSPAAAPVGSLALNELQAAMFQSAPVALVPPLSKFFFFFFFFPSFFNINACINYTDKF